MEWSIYNHLYYSEKIKKHLLYSSLSNMLIELDKDGYNEILEIKKNPESIDIKKSQYNFLLDGRFIVQSNANEINKLMLTTFAQRFNPKSFSLTIAPTRFCNFCCPYCYEKDRVNKKMSKKVQEGIIDFVKKYDTVKFLNIVWYGGEPTLAIDVIKFLSTELQKIVEHYNAFMVTNGFYLDRIIDTIDNLKISGLQITLDGTRETHDQTRHLSNGKGTFDRILTNVDTLLSKHNVNISIRMNINTNNSSQYASLYKLLKERYRGKVHLYPAFVHDYGGGGCQTDTCYDDSYKKAVFLKSLFEKEGIYTKDLYPFRRSKGCMSQQQNAFLIGPEGELYKCWHHLGTKEKEVGNIFADKIITNYGLLSDMMIKGDAIFDNHCKSCVLFPSCNGGCSDNKNRGENDCIPAKTMLEDFLNIRHFLREKEANALEQKI